MRVRLLALLLALLPSLLAAQPSSSARYELVAWSTAGSLAAGVETALALDVEAPAVWAALLAGTTGAGFGLSWWASSGAPLTSGHSALYGWGIVFGTHLVTLGTLLADADPHLGPWLSLLGGAAGGTAGLLTARALEVSGGDAGLFASGGLWGAVVGLLLLPLLQPGTDTLAELTVLGTSAAGLLAGAFAATRLEPSRGAVRLVDLGAAVGGLALGGGALLAFARSTHGVRVVPAFALAGLLAGGVLAPVFFQRGDDGVAWGPRVPVVLTSPDLGVAVLVPLLAGAF